jgi:hypothetical protein
MNNQSKIFDDGYKIIYRRVCDTETGISFKEENYENDEEYQWRRFEGAIKTNVNKKLN